MKRLEAIQKYFAENPGLFDKLAEEYWNEAVKDIPKEDLTKPLKIKESE